MYVIQSHRFTKRFYITFRQYNLITSLTGAFTYESVHRERCRDLSHHQALARCDQLQAEDDRICERQTWDIPLEELI